MLSAVVRWLKEYCPEKQYLYTWADGIMGKPGYVYQAANFLYGGFIETEIYILPNGEKVHPRSSKRLLTENAAFKSERDPEFFKDRKRIYHLTTDFLDCKKIRHIKGRQFRYIFPLSKGARNRLKKSKVEWNLLYPKGKNLVWKERSMHGTEILNEMPHIDGSMTAYNSRNVNAHLRVQQ
jgi:hypothetical protein